MGMFVARQRLSPEQLAWAQRQPVRGRPSLKRLRAVLAKVGFENIALELGENRDLLTFSVRVAERVTAVDNDSLLRLWITTFRLAGFAVGFEEIGIGGLDANLISGCTLTGPINVVCEHGAPPIACNVTTKHLINRTFITGRSWSFRPVSTTWAS